MNLHSNMKRLIHVRQPHEGHAQPNLHSNMKRLILIHPRSGHKRDSNLHSNMKRLILSAVVQLFDFVLIYIPI